MMLKGFDYYSGLVPTTDEEGRDLVAGGVVQIERALTKRRKDLGVTPQDFFDTAVRIVRDKGVEIPAKAEPGLVVKTLLKAAERMVQCGHLGGQLGINIATRCPDCRRALSLGSSPTGWTESDYWRRSQPGSPFKQLFNDPDKEAFRKIKSQFNQNNITG